MTDCEHHQTDHGKSARRLIAAFVVIAVFMVVEAVGGIISGSLALIADSVHMFTDAFALALAASAHLISRRPADATFHFGYRRAQVLAAFANGILLMALLAWIFIEAVKRFFTPVEIDVVTMLWIAGLGLIANAVAFVVLHNARTPDVNVRGAMLHVVSDLFGSVAAIAAALIIMASGWTEIDPLLSIVVAILIGRSALRLVRETGHVLLEGAPDNIDVGALVAGVTASIKTVEDVHDVRIWQLTPGHASLTLHARVGNSEDAEATLDQIKSFLEENYGIRESTVQIEVGGACPDCPDDSPAPPARHSVHAQSARQPHHARTAQAGAAAFVGQK